MARPGDTCLRGAFPLRRQRLRRCNRRMAGEIFSHRSSGSGNTFPDHEDRQGHARMEQRLLHFARRHCGQGHPMRVRKGARHGSSPQPRDRRPERPLVTRRAGRTMPDLHRRARPAVERRRRRAVAGRLGDRRSRRPGRLDVAAGRDDRTAPAASAPIRAGQAGSGRRQGARRVVGRIAR